MNNADREIPKARYYACPGCNGEGRVSDGRRFNTYDAYLSGTEVCTRCRGNGTLTAEEMSAAEIESDDRARGEDDRMRNKVDLNS
jgi:DnaJ-class molecular chaperone